MTVAELEQHLKSAISAQDNGLIVGLTETIIGKTSGEKRLELLQGLVYLFKNIDYQDEMLDKIQEVLALDPSNLEFRILQVNSLITRKETKYLAQSEFMRLEALQRVKQLGKSHVAHQSDTDRLQNQFEQLKLRIKAGKPQPDPTDINQFRLLEQRIGGHFGNESNQVV